MPPHLSLTRGVFETIKAWRASSSLYVPFLELHLDRLFRGVDHFKLSRPTYREIERVIELGLRSFSWHLHTHALVRIIVTPESWWTTFDPWAPRLDVRRGARVTAIPGARSSPAFKACPATESVTAQELAIRKGYDEAVLCDEAGIITEGAWSNFFFFDRTGLLHTPPEHRCLPGVTRHIILDLTRTWAPSERTAHDSLMLAEECFLTLSTHGVVPIVEVDGVPVGSGAIGQRTLALADRYTELALSAPFTSLG